VTRDSVIPNTEPIIKGAISASRKDRVPKARLNPLCQSPWCILQNLTISTTSSTL